jgi:hypothetical protein
LLLEEVGERELSAKRGPSIEVHTLDLCRGVWSILYLAVLNSNPPLSLSLLDYPD